MTPIIHRRSLNSRILSWMAKKLIALLKYEVNELRHALAGVRVWGPPERVHVGKGVELQDALLNTVCGHIYFGAYAFCGHDCMFLTGTHDYKKLGAERQSTTGPTTGRNITVGRGVWMASRVTVLGNVTIADNCVICAGSVVAKSCCVPGIYAGVPAKLVKPLFGVNESKTTTSHEEVPLKK